MDQLRAMQAFVGVVDTGGFTSAAELLNMPKATLSACVAELETHLKVRLLHRTTRKVTVTADGAAYYERCVRILEDIRDAQESLSSKQGSPQGKLRVDVSTAVASRLLIPLLHTFFERYPDIELELGCSDRPLNLLSEGIDCALRVGPLTSSSLVARPLGHFALINCASPAYLERHGTPRTPADLPEHLAVNYASPTSGRAAPWEWLSDGEIATLRMRSQVAANNAETYIACALAGLGLIQIPAYDVREHLAAGELVEVLPDARAEPLPVQLVYPHRRNLSRRMQAFAGWLETVLADALDKPAPPAPGRPRKAR